MVREDWPEITKDMIPHQKDARFHLIGGLPTRMVIKVVKESGNIPAGMLGYIYACQLGVYGFDWHSTVPFNGFEVGIWNVLMVERNADDEIIETPYVDWVQTHPVICPRCRKKIKNTMYQDCKEELRIDKEIKKFNERAQKRHIKRKEHAAKVCKLKVPITDVAPKNMVGIETGKVKKLRHLAREYDYDFKGLIIETTDGIFGTLYAEGPKKENDEITSLHFHTFTIDMDLINDLPPEDREAMKEAFDECGIDIDESEKKEKKLSSEEVHALLSVENLMKLAGGKPYSESTKIINEMEGKKPDSNCPIISPYEAVLNEKEPLCTSEDKPKKT